MQTSENEEGETVKSVSPSPPLHGSKISRVARLVVANLSENQFALVDVVVAVEGCVEGCGFRNFVIIRGFGASRCPSRSLANLIRLFGIIQQQEAAVGDRFEELREPQHALHVRFRM